MTGQKPFRLFLRFGSALLLCGLVALLGCGSANPTATVTGTVTYKGEPLNSGIVTFYGKGDKTASGAIEPNGHYTIEKVPIGPANITVFTPPSVPDKIAKNVPHADGGTTVKPVQIPTKFADPKESGLTYTVNPGPQEYPIELK